MADERGIPPRLGWRPSVLGWLVGLALLALVAASFRGAGWSFSALAEGGPALWRFLSKAVPPDLSRLDAILVALFETLQMAIVGTLVGVLISLPLAVGASKVHSPNRVVHMLTRAFIALFRVVPDLVWALIFVITVGLGPFAGTLALTVDTAGFCGRFFAEAMEEADPGPQRALHAAGAPPAAVIGAGVFPATLPSMINTSLFALEKAVRSSVVLGLVGAGGIGIELKVSMDLFRFDQAATILLAIFVLILVVERASAWTRARIL